MVAGTGDANRDVQIGSDGLAGLADLPGCRDPASVDRGPRGADRGAEHGRQIVQIAEILRTTQSASPRDDDPGVVESRATWGLYGGLDHRRPPWIDEY